MKEVNDAQKFRTLIFFGNDPNMSKQKDSLFKKGDWMNERESLCVSVKTTEGERGRKCVRVCV